MRRGIAMMSVAAAAAAWGGLALPAQAAVSYRVTVTCSVPKAQPERQLAPNSCLNYIPDGTQTYTAKVRDSSGSPVRGVTVKWTDSDAQDALFRINQNPCVTNSSGIVLGRAGRQAPEGRGEDQRHRIRRWIVRQRLPDLPALTDSTKRPRSLRRRGLFDPCSTPRTHARSPPGV